MNCTGPFSTQLNNTSKPLVGTDGIELVRTSQNHRIVFPSGDTDDLELEDLGIGSPSAGTRSPVLAEKFLAKTSRPDPEIGTSQNLLGQPREFMELVDHVVGLIGAEGASLRKSGKESLDCEGFGF